MIPRERTATLLLILLAVSNIVQSEDGPVYDKSEWIPIDCHNCYDAKQVQAKSEQPNDRILLVENQSGPEYQQWNNKPKRITDLDSAARRLPKRQQPAPPTGFPQNVRLNEGEIALPHYVNQQLFPTSQIPQFVPNRQNAPLQPQLTLLAPGQQYFPQNQQFGSPPFFVPQVSPNAGNLNYYQQNYNIPPVVYPQQPAPKSNTSLTYKLLSPGNDISGQGNLRNINNLALSNTAALNKPSVEKESVQLVYVPIESLNQRPQQSAYQPLYAPQSDLVSKNGHFQQPQHKINPVETPNQRLIFKQQDYLQPTQHAEDELLQNNYKRKIPLRPEVSSYQNFVPTLQNTLQPHKQQQLQSIQNDFARQALESLKLQLQFDQNELRHPQYTTPSAYEEPTTRKLKSHQPPLAVYMGGGGGGDVSVNEVLSLLKNAKSITVQDEIKSNSPKVFVGPNNLNAPEGYVKFDLPYLNSIDSNRIERKVDQFPFFVAPLSYKAPEGYSKIPLPPPHVGSVVVSQKDRQQEKFSRPQQQIRFENFYGEDHYQVPNIPSYRVEPQKPVRLQNVIGENPYSSFDSRPTYSNSLPKPLPNPPAVKYPLTPRPDPLRQTINQYELEQINSQFIPSYYEQFEDEGPKQEERIPDIYNYNTRFNKTILPEAPANVQYITEKVQTTTTDLSNQNYRIAFKSNHPAASAPATQSNVDKNKYTVLEEFSINSNPSTTQPNYIARLTLPAKPVPTESAFPQTSQISFKLIENKPQYNFLPERPQPPPRQQQKEIKQQPTVQTYVQPPHPSYSFFDLNNNDFVPTQNENIYKLVSTQDIPQESVKESQPVLTTTPRFAPTTPVTTTAQENFDRSPGNNYNLRGSHQTTTQVYHESREPTNYNNDNYDSQDNLQQLDPNLHNLILQDQNLRPLLIPASIAPAVDQSYNSQRLHPQHQPSTPYVESTSAYSTTRLLTTTPAPTIETTTPVKRQRGRQRLKVTTSTYAPATRTSPRTRKPTTRTRVNRYRPSEQDEYSKPVYNPPRERVTTPSEEEDVKPSRQPVQRFRSRTRPTSRVPVTQRTSTTAFQEEHEADPSLESRIQVSSASLQQPQSYMQFEQPIEEIKRPVYSGSSTQRSFSSSEYTKAADQPQMSVDVVINHPMVDSNNQEGQTVRYNRVRYNENDEPSEVNDDLVSTTVRLSPFRPRVRSRPTTRTTTPILVATTPSIQKSEDEEFYGFIRQPNFNRPANLQIQNKKFTESPKLYSSTYVSTTKEPAYNIPTESSPHIDHVTENEIQIHPNGFASSTSTPKVEYRIRPKFSLSTTGVSSNYDSTTAEIATSKRYTMLKSPTTTTVAPKRKITGRMRVPSKKYSSRGSSHYKVPENLKPAADEDDVEGGNYPVQFLRAQGITERPKFQITVNPDATTAETSDQVPYSSIYQPRLVDNGEENREFSNSNGGPGSNYISVERKVVESQEQFSDDEKTTERVITDFTSGDGDSGATEQPLSKSSALALEEAPPTTTRKPRRRGSWKVIKRPVDPFETAESQNIGNILINSFTSEEKKPLEKGLEIKEKWINKEEAITTVKPSEIIESDSNNQTESSTPKQGFLDSFLDILGINNEDGEVTDDTVTSGDVNDETTLPQTTETTTTLENLITTTSDSVPLPPPSSDSLISISQKNSVNETNLKISTNSVSNENVTSKVDIINSEPTTQQPNVESQTFNFESIKTSISTEISHETEICYRGKCVKTNGIKPKV